MADDTKAEITRISQQLTRLNEALTKERTDRQTEQKRQQQQLEEIVGIIVDYDEASSKVLRYFIKLEGRFNNLILALQDAVMGFNEFLRLPATSNNLMKYWDVAWAALAVVLPMLRVSSQWVQLEQTASAEMRAAKFALDATSVKTQLATMMSRGHNIADFINKENTLASKIRDVSKKKPKADMARTPIKAMMEEGNLAHKALEEVVGAIWREYLSRLTYAITETPFPRKEPLSKMVDRLLPNLNYLEDDEAEQVKRSYLFEICKAWAPTNVAIVTTQFRTGDTVTIDGLNDTQQDQIMSWFGSNSNWVGGKVPVLPNIYYYLGLWLVPKTTKRAGGFVFGSG
ncbi:MAG: hypothetical protein AAB288_11640 [Acidobacteriota bacterium]